MMLVEHKSIIKRLSKTCIAALEAAASQCVNARHYEITVEHLLLNLLDDANSDIAFLVMHYDLDPARLRQALQRSLSDLRTGNAGKPVFSPMMLEWMQDAFVVGSMDYGYTKIRSGVLFSRSSLRSSPRSQPLWTNVSLPSGRTSVTVACRSTLGFEERTRSLR